MFLDFPDTQAMPSHGVVIRRDSPVFSRESTASATIANLAEATVLRRGIGVRPGWQRVTLPDGRQGYMLDQHIRSPSATRAYFEKIGGRWWLTGFYGGID
jgi:hypothetical protein